MKREAMSLVEKKKGVVTMVIMIMLVLAHADDKALSPQVDQNIHPESINFCRIWCKIKCSGMKYFSTMLYKTCLVICSLRCKNTKFEFDTNHCIAEHQATSFSVLKDINDRDGVEAFVNSFFEDCKSK
ncbi:hypothetical protein Lalb_Chr15g0078181 [Lupinus albus]|uniref:Uncharacterized protein n=1 Tax=Lupinus albus TaxID=3870 RepID=A0A6A4NXA0_LUPAL|nr:hypothetical protein Lalb_Chr15g0078181 [Lupinus albus]